MTTRKSRLILAIGLLGALTGCASGESTEVNWVGPPPPPHAAHCPLQIFPAGPPPDPHQDIGYARADCPAFARDRCFADLKRSACRSGADTIYGLNESVAGDTTYLTATFSRRVCADKQNCATTATN